MSIEEFVKVEIITLRSSTFKNTNKKFEHKILCKNKHIQHKRKLKHFHEKRVGIM